MLRTLVIADEQGEVVEEVDVQLQADRVSLLTTSQMAEYCDEIRLWAAGAPLHLDIPTPDKRWKIHQRQPRQAA